MAVGNAIEPHGRPAGSGERHDHEEHGSGAHRDGTGSSEHSQQGKRQGEQRVWQLDQIDIANEQRLAAEGLRFTAAHLSPLTFSRMPSLPHISSTLRLVSASMVISSGHSRSKPSSFHFRVPSMPILLPKVNARLE